MKKNLFLERKTLPKEMKLIDRGFSQKIMDQHTNLQLFTTKFSPAISTKRISPRMKWLELVYALPYLVLRREILNSFKKTKNVLTSVKRMWNILVRFEFPLSRYEYTTTRLHRFSREKMKMQDTRYKMQIKPVSDILYPVSSPSGNLVKDRDFYFAYPYAHIERETLQNGQKMNSYFKSSSMELAQPASYETSKRETKKESPVKNYQLPVVTHQSPVVSHMPSAVRYDEDQATYILSSTSDITTPLFSYYSFNPALFLSQKTVPVKQREALLNLQKSDAVYRPYAQLDRETMQKGQRIISNSKSSSMELAQPASYETSKRETKKESPVKNYQLPVVTHQPPVVSHKPPAARYEDQATYILRSASDITTPLFSYLLSTLRHKPAVVSNESMEKTSIFSSAKEFITPLFSYYSAQKIKTGVGEKAIYDIPPYFNFRNNKQMHTSEVEKAPIYHTYPEIEHVTSTHTEIMKERVIEKGEESEPPHATPQLPSIDVNRLADQVYQMMERKLRIERERRGLYG